MPLVKEEGGTALAGTLNYAAKYTPSGAALGVSMFYDNGTGAALGTNAPIANTLFTAKGTSAVANDFTAKFVNSADANILTLENNKSAIFGGEVYMENNTFLYAKNSVGTYEQVLIGRSAVDNITSLTYGAGGFILKDKDLTSSLWVRDDNVWGFGFSFGETTHMTSKYNFKVSSADADGIRFQNTGATDGVGSFVISAGGATGYGISGWANSSIIENANTGSLVLGSYLSDIKFQTGARVTNMTLKSTGTLNITGLQTGNAGLSSGDLYVDTAANILANGDLVVGRKV